MATLEVQRPPDSGSYVFCHVRGVDVFKGTEKRKVPLESRAECHDENIADSLYDGEKKSDSKNKDAEPLASSSKVGLENNPNRGVGDDVGVAEMIKSGKDIGESSDICVSNIERKLVELTIKGRKNVPELKSEQKESDDNNENAQEDDDDCKVIPRGKDQRRGMETKPYERQTVKQPVFKYQDGYGQVKGLRYDAGYDDINGLNSGIYGGAGFNGISEMVGGTDIRGKEGYSGGTVLVRSPPMFDQTAYTPPQVVYVKPISMTYADQPADTKRFFQASQTKNESLPQQLDFGHLQNTFVREGFSPLQTNHTHFISPNIVMPQLSSTSIHFSQKPGMTQSHTLSEILSPLPIIPFPMQPNIAMPQLPSTSFHLPQEPWMAKGQTASQMLSPLSYSDEDSALEEPFEDIIEDVKCPPSDSAPSPSSGYGTPPYEPLDDLQVFMDENGELFLGVGGAEDQTVVEKPVDRYLRFVSSTSAIISDEEQEDVGAYRAIADFTDDTLVNLDSNGNTVIVDVVAKCGPSFLKALLDRYHRMSLLFEFINKENNMKRTPLHFAVHLRDVQKTRHLVKRGAEVNVPVYTKVSTGEKKLKRECLVGHVASAGDDGLPVLVELLCSPSVDLNCFDSEGCTPLHSAIMSHNVNNVDSRQIIHHLILRGADVNIQNSRNSKTPLYCAAERGDKDLVLHLFKVVQLVYSQDHETRIRSMVQPGFPLLKMVYDLQVSLGQKVDLLKLLLIHGAELTQKSSDSALRKELMNMPRVGEVMKSLSAAKRRLKC